MDEELKDQIRAWKAAMDRDNQRTIEIRRNRTIAERFELLQTFLDGHGKNLDPAKRAKSKEHFMPYGEVQRRISARINEIKSAISSQASSSDS